MICYRDRSYCSASMHVLGDARCVNSECPRNITDEDAARAKAADLLFSVSPYRVNGCGFKAARDQVPPLQQEQTGET